MLLPAVCLGLVIAGGCQETVNEPSVDMQALRQAVARKTEQIYYIHLKLDSASSDLSAADQKVQAGDCSDAGYLVAESYRNVQKADEALLELGRDLQELFNLDMEIADRN